MTVDLPADIKARGCHGNVDKRRLRHALDTRQGCPRVVAQVSAGHLLRQAAEITDRILPMLRQIPDTNTDA
ncbi:hypothetical protein AB0465_40765 [Streptomyces griseoviridis]|uniref:hypothetical protein n=1 Tax=Streptomyces griseoviridis TaxID=45398 RepID=UPI0033C2EA41